MSSNLTLSAIRLTSFAHGFQPRVECSERSRRTKGDKIKNWCVYILQCSDDTYYTGITNDIEKRLQAHNSGKGAKYTSGRTPVKLVYSKKDLTESESRKEEFFLKSLKRKEKEKIIFGEVAY